jgi:hypothetical protein
MIRKGQILEITRRNPHGQAWAFAALLGVRHQPQNGSNLVLVVGNLVPAICSSMQEMRMYW